MKRWTHERLENSFRRSLLRLVGAPYRFGGRSGAGIDCSSLIVRGIREAMRLNVAALSWMTADQLARGLRGVTRPFQKSDHGRSAALVFFDWDEDGIYEHVAVRLLDDSWIWSSSSAGRVVRIDPTSERVLKRQWREIEGALDCSLSHYRAVHWPISPQL